MSSQPVAEEGGFSDMVKIGNKGGEKGGKKLLI
jgi:hypothetical protein